MGQHPCMPRFAMSGLVLLLIEDNPDDVFIMRRALQKAGIDLPLHVACDGKEALDYLEGKGVYDQRDQYPLPALVFLDLKLPYLSGFDVLEWIREHPSLRELEVIVLSSSSEDRDENRAHQLGVSAYMVKPPKPEALLETISLILNRMTVAE